MKKITVNKREVMVPDSVTTVLELKKYLGIHPIDTLARIKKTVEKEYNVDENGDKIKLDDGDEFIEFPARGISN